MLDDIQDERKVEVNALFLAQVRKLKVNPVVGARPAELERLRRNLVAAKLTIGRHAKLQLAQNLARAASCFANCFRAKSVPFEELQNVFRLEGRFLDVPCGIFLQVRAVFVDFDERSGSARNRGLRMLG